MSRVQIPSAAPFALRVLARRCANVRDVRGIRDRRRDPRLSLGSAGKCREVTLVGINGGYKSSTRSRGECREAMRVSFAPCSPLPSPCHRVGAVDKPPHRCSRAIFKASSPSGTCWTYCGPRAATMKPPSRGHRECLHHQARRGYRHRGVRRQPVAIGESCPGHTPSGAGRRMAELPLQWLPGHRDGEAPT